MIRVPSFVIEGLIAADYEHVEAIMVPRGNRGNVDAISAKVVIVIERWQPGRAIPSLMEERVACVDRKNVEAVRSPRHDCRIGDERSPEAIVTQLRRLPRTSIPGFVVECSVGADDEYVKP